MYNLNYKICLKKQYSQHYYTEYYSLLTKIIKWQKFIKKKYFY